MNMEIPELSLVVLIGPSGSGKSTFARKHFLSTEVISSDFCRALVADDENDLSATKRAFEVLHFIVSKRLESGKLALVDATNVRPEDRKSLVELAKAYHTLPVAIVFDLPEKVSIDRNWMRTDRALGPHVVHQQVQQMHRGLRNLEREGFRHVFTFRTEADVEAATIQRRPLWTNRREDHGPFDIIGDVHGCFDELVELLQNLGYDVTMKRDGPVSEVPAARHPLGRKAIFLGDLVDRGPNTPAVLQLVMNMVEAGSALCVPGNHEQKLLRKLQGRDVQVSHGLEKSLKQLEQQSPEFRKKVAEFLDGLISHFVLDGGKLVVAHAGMKEELQGRASKVVREFALFGETTGETDEFGLPVRYNWAEKYRGHASVVYGHTPVPEPQWINRTINLDTGCVFGGKLTALRYPEMDLVNVAAHRQYYAPAKPFLATDAGRLPHREEARAPDLLDIKDVLGKRIVSTRLHRNVTIREENSIAALEVMSRFAANPRWIVYLPPTMSPPETTRRPGLLEHPDEAFDYYHRQGVDHVVCEEKHMGSRAIVVLCRNADVAHSRFGATEGEIGICYTRTGRPFFEDDNLEAELLSRLATSMEAAGLWEKLSTNWVCLDCELMPWSAKAQELLREQYAAVGTAARAGLTAAVQLFDQAHGRGVDLGGMTDRYRQRLEMTGRYVDAYRRYCWPVRSLSDLRLAPFHLIATEAGVHVDKEHLWHLENLGALCDGDGQLLLKTQYRLVDLNDTESRKAGVEWWERLTSSGAEGMVVKPLDFVAKGRRGLVQPAIKCRGLEYLRIIYGPEYTAQGNLERLRSRSLSTKRSLALREFALGIEGLERFVKREPLYRVHECVFGVLALESEPVDPRL